MNELSSLAGKRIFVTGADGFIGSHLTELLLGHGAEVKALAWYHPQQNQGWLDEIAPSAQLTFVSGDIRDAHQCRKWVADCDMVFHLAALIGIPYSYEAPHSYYQTNVEATLHLLEASKEAGARFLFMSTSEVYGSAQVVPIAESHPLQPQSPYSASKIGAEALVRSYFYSFEMPVFVARVFNTYGPRQSTRAILPTVITQLASGKKQLMLGDLSTTRDLVYVKDTCQALIELINCDQAAGLPVNICTGIETTMSDLVELVQTIMETKAEIRIDPQRLRPAGSEVDRLCGDASLLDSLGIQPPLTRLHDGLRQTIDWFQQHFTTNTYKPDQYHV